MLRCARVIKKETREERTVGKERRQRKQRRRDVIYVKQNEKEKRCTRTPVLVKLWWGWLHRVATRRGMWNHPTDQSEQEALSRRITMLRVIHSSVVLNRYKINILIVKKSCNRENFFKYTVREYGLYEIKARKLIVSKLHGHRK